LYGTSIHCILTISPARQPDKTLFMLLQNHYNWDTA